MAPPLALTLTSAARALCVAHVGAGIWIEVAHRGCSGARYTVRALDAQEDRPYCEVVTEGVIVRAPAAQRALLSGVVIDAELRAEGPGFVICDPPAVCGCGPRFGGVKDARARA